MPEAVALMPFPEDPGRAAGRSLFRQIALRVRQWNVDRLGSGPESGGLATAIGRKFTVWPWGARPVEQRRDTAAPETNKQKSPVSFWTVFFISTEILVSVFQLNLLKNLSHNICLLLITLKLILILVPLFLHWKHNRLDIFRMFVGFCWFWIMSRSVLGKLKVHCAASHCDKVYCKEYSIPHSLTFYFGLLLLLFFTWRYLQCQYR